MSRLLMMPPWKLTISPSDDSFAYPNSVGNPMVELNSWAGLLPRTPPTGIPASPLLPALWYHEAALSTWRMPSSAEPPIGSDYFQQPAIPFGTAGTLLRAPKAVILVNTNQGGLISPSLGGDGLADLMPADFLEDLAANNIYIGCIFERPNQMTKQAQDDGITNLDGQSLFLYGIPRIGYESIAAESRSAWASSGDEDLSIIVKEIDIASFIGGQVFFAILSDEGTGPNYFEFVSGIPDSEPLFANEIRYAESAGFEFSMTPYVAAMNRDRDLNNLIAANFSSVKWVRYQKEPAVGAIGSMPLQAQLDMRAAIAARLPDNFELQNVSNIAPSAVIEDHFIDDVTEFFGL